MNFNSPFLQEKTLEFDMKKEREDDAQQRRFARGISQVLGRK